MKIKFAGLWLHANFRKLWAGQAASLVGSKFIFIVLPLTAIMVLEATPIQMGIISAMAGVPALIGIFLGVWVDRRPRGPILVGADIGRMLLVLVVPIAHAFDALTIELLIFVSLGIGTMSMLFEIAYRSFLPSVVARRELVEANSKLEVANSGSTAIGPGIGGGLVELVTAPFALIFGAVMYSVSAVMFKSLRDIDQDVQGNNEGESVLKQVKTGVGFFRSNRTLIGIGVAAASLVFWGMAYDAILILYMVRELEFTAGMVGLVISLGSIGLLTASIVSTWLTRRIGVGPTLMLGFVVMGFASFLLPAARGSTAVVFATVVVAEISFMLGVVIWNIGHVSLRQAITPERLLGRITSLTIVASRAALPVGALLGGFLGEYLGLRTALVVFAAGMLLSGGWLVVFGVWRVREMPGVADGDGG